MHRSNSTAIVESNIAVVAFYLNLMMRAFYGIAILSICNVHCQLVVQDQHNMLHSSFDLVYQRAIQRIYDNMPTNAPPGTLIASPSKSNPDYYYHWIRDASIVYKTMLAVNNTLGLDLAKITKVHQRVDLGEPKFYIDGRVYDKPWGRPQNDGPALRVLALSAFVKSHIHTGGSLDGISFLYRAEMPAQSIIKKDLEFIAHVWHKKCFDLWEEQFALHYYTRSVQMAALGAGSEIAILFNDSMAASYYKRQSDSIKNDMSRFWDKRGFIQAMIEGGETNRLDISVVLACLHSKKDNDKVCSGEKTLATVARLSDSFGLEYPINYNQEIPLVGRYASDLYNGTGVDVGNPWILATFSMAEYFYTIASEFNAAQVIQITNVSLPFYIHFFPGANLNVGNITGCKMSRLLQSMVKIGDGFINRILAIVDDNFSEQLHRESGARVGARDLTWSYATFVSAYHARLKCTSNALC